MTYMSNAEANYAPSPANVDAVIGENVHQLMWRAKETQVKVSELLGMTQSALSNKLRGKRPWFAGEIDAIARHYQVSVAALFTPLGGPNMHTPDYEVAGSADVARIVNLSDIRDRRSARAALIHDGEARRAAQ